MSRVPLKCTIVLLVASAALASCGGRGVSSGGGGSTGTAPVVLTMTDTPPNERESSFGESDADRRDTWARKCFVCFPERRQLNSPRLQTDIAI